MGIGILTEFTQQKLSFRHEARKGNRPENRMDGAEDGTRTRDLLITNQLLYQLSYFGAECRTREHATRAPSRKRHDGLVLTEESRPVCRWSDCASCLEGRGLHPAMGRSGFGFEGRPRSPRRIVRVHLRAYWR